MKLLIPLAAITLLCSDAATQRNRARRGGGTWQFLSKKYDKDKNGKITFKEYARDKKKFASLDANGDGVLEQDDFSGGRRGRRGRRRSTGKLPQPGDVAPDFDLPLVKDSKKSVKLSSFRGKRPVALIFGSYT